MGIGNKLKSLTKKEKVVISCIAAVIVVAAAAICFAVFRNNMLANTMRLLRIQGTVNLEDSKGVTKPVMENLRFQSGDALITGADGLASIGMDDTKIVTLQNDSRAEFRKKRKQLELKLTKGAVFFNVTEKLKEDERFEIKTSTMTAGIRGTSGIVYYDSKDDFRESVMVTDGEVTVSATNPKDNVTRSVKVTGGQKVKVYFYENDNIHDSVEFKLTDITEDDFKGFMLGWLADNDDLLTRMSNYLDWDKDKLRNILRGIADGSIVPEPTPEPTTVPETTTSETTTAATETSETTPPPETTKPAKKVTKKPVKKVTKAPVRKKKKKKTSSEPKVPSGYTKVVWGKTYDGHKVYIVGKNLDSDEPTFLGYSKGWKSLTYDYSTVGAYKYVLMFMMGNTTYYVDYLQSLSDGGIIG